MQRLRSFIFDGLFYPLTALYLIFFLPLMLVSPVGVCKKLYSLWGAATMWGLRIIVGLRYEIRGVDHLNTVLQQGPCILACKHQSAWETIIFSQLVKNFRIVLKRELISVPVFGLYLKKLNSISLDRAAGAKALKSLLVQARQSINENHSILIFPEGTRGAPFIATTYQPGIGVLYKDLGVPVLPIALNAGAFWGRRCAYKKSGMIILEFLPPLLPGMSREVFMEKLATTLDTASKRLLS